jgi:hypothetical protein
VSFSAGCSGRSFSERDPLSPRALGDEASFDVPVPPRVLLPGGVPVSRPRALGDAVGRVLLAVERGVAAGVPRGMAEACGPAGVALAPALPTPAAEPVVVAAPVVVLAPVVALAPLVVVAPVVVLPETPTPTAAPPLTP